MTREKKAGLIRELREVKTPSLTIKEKNLAIRSHARRVATEPSKPPKIPISIEGTKREGEVNIFVGERKGPKKTVRKGKPYVDIGRLPLAIVRLPPRTWTCMHGREVVCPHCVEGVQMRVQYGAALAQKPAPRILRIDFWRCSSDSTQRKAAGMLELNSTAALLQHEMVMHAKYPCDGCRHCKEEELLYAKG